MIDMHQDIIPIIDRAVDKATEKYTNGKLRDFRREQDEVNKKQNEALEDIQFKTKSLIDLYDGSNNFFRTTGAVAVWIGKVSVALVASWAFIKFVVLSANK